MALSPLVNLAPVAQEHPSNSTRHMCGRAAKTHGKCNAEDLESKWALAFHENNSLLVRLILC